MPKRMGVSAKTRALIRLALFGLMIAGLVVAAQSGLGQKLGDAEAVRAWVEDFGALGPLVFGGAFVGVTLLLMPPTALTLLSGVLFGPLVGLAIAVVGVNIGGALLFFIARAIGRKGVARLLPQKLLNLDKRLRRNGLLTVVLVRLAFVPFGLVCLSMGVSGIRMRDYFLGTLVGTFPSTFMLCWLGDSVLAMLDTGSIAPLVRAETLLALLLFVLAAAFPFVLRWAGRR